MDLNERHKINVIYTLIWAYDYKSTICTCERGKKIKIFI